jgi:hypothetical protein
MVTFEQCSEEIDKIPLREQSSLNLGEFHGRGTCRIIVQYGVDPFAHWIAPHCPGIERLQQFGRRSDIRHSGIKPQLVAIWIEDYCIRSWTADVTAFGVVGGAGKGAVASAGLDGACRSHPVHS